MVDTNGKRTVIIGASTNPGRYAFIAAEMLTESGNEIIPVGIKAGSVSGKAILNLRDRPLVQEVDTVTLYIGPRHQPEWYSYILSLKPKRIIFNPGTENREFQQMAEEAGIDVVEGCTLVMLKSHQF
jgi:uncharacterized protein